MNLHSPSNAFAHFLHFGVKISFQFTVNKEKDKRKEQKIDFYDRKNRCFFFFFFWVVGLDGPLVSTWYKLGNFEGILQLKYIS